MLGYLDTTDVSVTEVIVDGLPPEIAGGFDVFVYMLGGVLGRGGTYTVTADGASASQDNVQTAIDSKDPTSKGAEGNYLLFEGLIGDSVTIEASLPPLRLCSALRSTELRFVPRVNVYRGRIRSRVAARLVIKT